MRIVFQGDQKQISWELPMINRVDERSIMDWIEKNRGNAELINAVAQSIRLIHDLWDASSKKK